jgi:uncharacterized protein YbbC (DUF1343 family)
MKMTRKTLIFILLVITGYSATSQVKTGIEVLREKNFEPLAGKRVGLITNPTGVDSNLKSTIDILAGADQSGTGSSLWS